MLATGIVKPKLFLKEKIQKPKKKNNFCSSTFIVSENIDCKMIEKLNFNGNVNPITCHAWNKDRSRKCFFVPYHPIKNAIAESAYSLLSLMHNITKIVKTQMTHLCAMFCDLKYLHININ